MSCEFCHVPMLPNMLNEYKTGNVIAVHVCPNCGLVTRDNEPDNDLDAQLREGISYDDYDREQRERYERHEY